MGSEACRHKNLPTGLVILGGCKKKFNIGRAALLGNDRAFVNLKSKECYLRMEAAIVECLSTCLCWILRYVICKIGRRASFNLMYGLGVLGVTR